MNLKEAIQQAAFDYGYAAGYASDLVLSRYTTAADAARTQPVDTREAYRNGWLAGYQKRHGE